MEQNQSLVSINLLTWNCEKYIKDCLNSVFEQTYGDIEVLVIDNNSTEDKTIEYLKEIEKNFKDRNLKIIFNPKNIGFSAGHNQAIKESKGEYILCLNQDVILDKNFVSNAVKIFNQDKRTAAVQGKLMQFNKNIIDTTGLIMFKNRRIINRGQGQINKGQFEKNEEIFGVDGAVPVYSRKALEDIKISVPNMKNPDGEYFDESFFAYKEDVDLAWRFRLYGWKAFYQPKSIAYHDRTSGESATKSYYGIIKERLKINKFGKYLSFKNQRLMQIKNEQLSLLFKHILWFFPKEICSWIYILLFERYTCKAIKDLFNQMPLAWNKRKVIMNKKKISQKEMNKWFK